MKKILAMMLVASTSSFAMLPNPQTTVSYGISSTNTPLPRAGVSQTSILTNAQNEVEQAVFAYLVQTAGTGQEQLVPINQNTPITKGDVVEYHSYFTNKTPNRIASMTAMVSVPSGVELMSIEPNDAFGSVDGTKFSRMPLRTLVNGQPKEVPLSRYKAVRFDIDNIGIGASASVKYRAKIR